MPKSAPIVQRLSWFARCMRTPQRSFTLGRRLILPLLRQNTRRLEFPPRLRKSKTLRALSWPRASASWTACAGFMRQVLSSLGSQIRLERRVLGGGGAVFARGTEDARLVGVEIETVGISGARLKGVALYAAVDVRISERVLQRILDRLGRLHCLPRAITEGF